MKSPLDGICGSVGLKAFPEQWPSDKNWLFEYHVQGLCMSI